MQDTQIAVRISSQLLTALDELRRKEKDLPTRAEMLRRLVERASDAKHKRQASPVHGSGGT
jgi:metal-responsive CopG/Arc/MetJ family transcriptional regulator